MERPDIDSSRRLGAYWDEEMEVWVICGKEKNQVATGSDDDLIRFAENVLKILK